MRFTAAIPTFLALLSLVSARMTILSPLEKAVLKHNELYTVKWCIDSDGLYSTIDLYLMCEYQSTTTVVSAIEKGIDLATTSVTFSASFTHKCDGYFIKAVASNLCGIRDAFFSPMFFITLDGEAIHRPLVCDVQTTEIPTSTLESVPQKTSDTPKDDKSHETTPPEDSTPTMSQPQSPSSPTKDKEEPPKDTEEPPKDTEPTVSEPDEPQKPITPGQDSASSTSSDASAPDKAPDKKSNDIDNSGSLVTFKLFGILLSIIIAFLYY